MKSIKSRLERLEEMRKPKTTVIFNLIVGAEESGRLKGVRIGDKIFPRSASESEEAFVARVIKTHAWPLGDAFRVIHHIRADA
ncbi:MAG: hypothetical protein WCR74_05890 [Betaproteobacteria bacterium]